MPKSIENPFTSIGNTIAFDVRDWAEDKRLAWIYGIACGWDVEDGDVGELEAMAELQAKFKWDDDTVMRLRRLRAIYKAAELNAQSACERCGDTKVVASLKRNEEGEPMELPCPEPTHFIAKVAR